jgi:hypothetical protein
MPTCRSSSRNLANSANSPLAGEVADRQALSRRIYDYLVEHTDWDLTLDSDDVIASRIKSQTK